MSGRDQAIIERQIGRKVRGAIKVAKRCRFDYPQVIINSPILEDGTPFPTVLWLSCPLLKRLVSRLEVSGWVKALQERLKDDKDLRDELSSAHDDYRSLSRSLIDKEKDMHKGDMNLGICGVKDMGSVKCLHGHYAHYLATGKNPIGRMVDGWVAFDDDCSYCDRWQE
ncbi:MAG: DUF501 domain-containing protein [Actinomycetota bacterium]|nr:DUF501 domain-containing protein [Actinomycetota bacterium]